MICAWGVWIKWSKLPSWSGIVVLCSWARHLTLTVPLSTQPGQSVREVCQNAEQLDCELKVFQSPVKLKSIETESEKSICLSNNPVAVLLSKECQ